MMVKLKYKFALLIADQFVCFLESLLMSQSDTNSSISSRLCC